MLGAGHAWMRQAVSVKRYQEPHTSWQLSLHKTHITMVCKSVSNSWFSEQTQDFSLNLFSTGISPSARRRGKKQRGKKKKLALFHPAHQCKGVTFCVFWSNLPNIFSFPNNPTIIRRLADSFISARVLKTSLTFPQAVMNPPPPPLTTKRAADRLISGPAPLFPNAHKYIHIITLSTWSLSCYNWKFN